MKFEDFVKAIEAVVPTAAFEEDNYGQIVIYTGLIWDDGDVREMTEEEIDGDDWGHDRWI